MAIFVFELRVDEVVILVNQIENINLKIHKLEFWKEAIFIKLLLGIEEQLYCCFGVVIITIVNYNNNNSCHLLSTYYMLGTVQVLHMY